jgi:exodeoxyribonuclease VII small subunit
LENAGRLGKVNIKKLSFEEAYERLNEMAGKLERGNLSLEESLALYEEGILLSRHCQGLLDKAELRVNQIGPDSFRDESED